MDLGENFSHRPRAAAWLDQTETQIEPQLIRYNSLLRELVSFEQSLDQRQRLQPPRGEAGCKPGTAQPKATPWVSRLADFLP